MSGQNLAHLPPAIHNDIVRNANGGAPGSDLQSESVDDAENIFLFYPNLIGNALAP